ncbi:uncharacterized protein K452DRAFT_66270 [Aplosporella prunicola CBS 121167]|uniref:Uncharacterized protein n=1 Tax=Aplosporella prunicola CBS 121167 TaxID=1176127 RepID=A0A6A6BUZ5_9PEZI|nr:uncharacterized protein K452DRAFT_66270 [Aplosporella prunicola CBS 121167]KAF2146481.1 hypothetical protein K452DRAFT_66270 [Aplosporella prunicola CBS 121167]
MRVFHPVLQGNGFRLTYRPFEKLQPKTRLLPQSVSVFQSPIKSPASTFGGVGVLTITIALPLPASRPRFQWLRFSCFLAFLRVRSAFPRRQVPRDCSK